MSERLHLFQLRHPGHPVGYGDLTAAGGIGRALTVIEGLLGQIYLVTTVAALVGNLGRTRTPSN